MHFYQKDKKYTLALNMFVLICDIIWLFHFIIRHNKCQGKEKALINRENYYLYRLQMDLALNRIDAFSLPLGRLIY